MSSAKRIMVRRAQGNAARKTATIAPHGDHPLDCDFTIGEVKTVDGESIFGVIWYAGGEAWAWQTYDSALRNARETAENIDLARRYGRTRSGLPIT